MDSLLLVLLLLVLLLHQVLDLHFCGATIRTLVSVQAPPTEAAPPRPSTLSYLR